MVMKQLPAIDRKETISAARQYFDERVPRLENIARTSIKASISDGVKTQHGVNSDDSGMVARIDAKNELKFIVSLIEELDGNEAKFMKYRYTDNLSWDQINAKVDYSQRMGQNFVNEAFFKLAERAGDEFGLVVYK